jgi:hypothetical protein
MRKIFHALIAIVLFTVLSGVLVVYVTPFFTTRDLSASLGEPTESRVPVLIYLQEAGRPTFVVTQLRHLNKVTEKYPGHTFLLPTGSNSVVDQDEDPATYTATMIQTGRQRIQLTAMVGDYLYNVEYEAEENEVFPLRADVDDKKQGALLAMSISLFLTWLAMRIAMRRSTVAPTSDAADRNPADNK